MTIDEKDMINSILESVSRIDYIKPEDIPNIDLYMDQVTTFMEEQLVSTKRYEEDKILTKTMINNYAKNNLLPSPEVCNWAAAHEAEALRSAFLHPEYFLSYDHPVLP